MVLSNKKLKQKRRAELAANSITTPPPSNAPNPQPPPRSPSPQQQKSNIRLNKREKRRENTLINGEKKNGVHVVEKEAGKEDELNYKSSGVTGKKRKRVGEGDAAGSVRGVNEDDEKKKGKTKKKKRKGTESSGEMGSEKGKGMKEEVGNEIQNKKNVKNKKNKKKHKKKKKMKNNEVGKGGEMVSGTGAEAVAEKITEKDCNGFSEIVCKVYVGGIPYYSTEDDIRSFFDHCGTITEIDCMKFLESGKFRGIAIISFKTEEAAKRALALDGADMGGLFLKIQPYKATRETKTKTSDFAPPVVEGYNRIYVGNLSWDITEEDLKRLFSGFNISSLRFGEDKETREFKGYAHVDFADKPSLSKALKLDQTVVCGRPVRIRCAVQKKIDKVQDLGPAQTAPKVNDGEEISRKVKGRTCYECGERGHISSSCPNKQAADQIKS